MRNKVPSEFYMGEAPPVVKTVKELRTQLNRLPDDLPIDVYSGGVSLHVYNIDRDAHLRFEDPDEE